MINVVFISSDKEKIWETDYILNYLLPEDEEKVDNFIPFEELKNNDVDCDVLVYNCRLHSYEEVYDIVKKLRPKVIFHLSDEYHFENLGYWNELANHCQLFLRQHHHPGNVYSENTIAMPLGYCNDAGLEWKYIGMVEDRKYNWSFIGDMKSDRWELVETFSQIDNYYTGSGIDKKTMMDIYRNSIFVPSGRGNSSINCFRLYEASMSGAIPVVVGSKEEIELTFMYEENPPWIFADSWQDAAQICKDLLKDKNKLQEIQSSVLYWWRKRIGGIRERISNALEYHYDKLIGLPPVHFISVDDSIERRDLLIEKFSKFGITDITPHIFKRYKDEDHVIESELLHRLSIGSRGPVTSHLKAIREWYENTNDEVAFFCEDDLGLETVRYWNFTWKEFYEYLPNDWGCVQLVWLREGDDFNRFSIGLRNRCWCDWSACAYLITREHARLLIENYYQDEVFSLNLVGEYVEERGEWARIPVVETIIFSPVTRVYGIPLFVEDVINCSSSYLSLMGNMTSGQCDVHHLASYVKTMEWWEKTAKNLSLDQLIVP